MKPVINKVYIYIDLKFCIKNNNKNYQKMKLAINNPLIKP